MSKRILFHSDKLHRISFALIICLILVGCQTTPQNKSATIKLTHGPTQMQTPIVTLSLTPIAPIPTVRLNTTEEPSDSWRPILIPYTPLPTNEIPDFDHLDVINRTNINRLTEVWRYEPRSRKAVGGSITFSPDGNFIIIDSGYSIDFWDLRAGKIAKSISPKMEDGKQVISWFTISQDGKKLALICSGAFSVWDVESGEMLSEQVDFPNLAPLYTSFTMSPDGIFLVTTEIMAGSDTRIWSTKTGKLYKSLENGNQLDAKFNADGTRLYISSRTTEDIQVWDTTTWKKLYSLTVPGQSANLELSSNNEIAVVSSLDMGDGPLMLRIYSLKKWEQIGEIVDWDIVDGMIPMGTSPSLNIDGGIIVYSPGRDYANQGSNIFEFWDTLTQRLLLKQETDHPGPVIQTIFSPDGRLVAVNMSNSTILFYAIP